MVIDPKTNTPTRVRRIRQADGTSVRVAQVRRNSCSSPAKAA